MSHPQPLAHNLPEKNVVFSPARQWWQSTTTSASLRKHFGSTPLKPKSAPRDESDQFKALAMLVAKQRKTILRLLFFPVKSKFYTHKTKQQRL